MAFKDIEKRREYNVMYKRKQRGERIPKPDEERKVMVYVYVPRKHYKEAQLLVTELAKQYR